MGDDDETVRPTCPYCGSTETIVRIFGMPTPDLLEFAHSVDWMSIEGCVVLGDDGWDLGCGACGFYGSRSDAEDDDGG